MKITIKHIEFNVVFLVYFCYFLTIQPVNAQSYGLEFKGQSVTLDKRTELDLTPDKLLKFKDNFEISFQYKAIRLTPNSNAGLFGYIFRIIDSNGDNIDLISSINPQLGLNLVFGKLNKIIPVKYSQDQINKWVKLRIEFLLSDNKLVFHTPDSSYVQENMEFEKTGSYKIIFGANDYKQFKSTDVPSMIIKDIEIFERSKLKYHWPLNEKENSIAIDKINGEKALVLNPSWLALMHQNWQNVYEDEIDGVVRLTANPENGEVYMVGKEKLKTFSTRNNSVDEIRYNNKAQFFDINYRAVYNSTDNKIYCYLVDELPFYSLDIKSGTWNSSGTPVNFQTRFRHHNSVYRGKDNSIYTFGGYGAHTYRNEINRISLSDSSIHRLKTDRIIFSPRYLAGLGVLNDTAYILGGYGSVTGNQLINPHSYFNLIGYSFESGELVEKFEIPTLFDDMVVGSNLWIDGETRNFYALVYGKVKFENQLQLIRGNLDSPEVEFVGDKIPFNFLDVRSFANLYYVPSTKKLYTCISYFNESNTQIKIYSINTPTNVSTTESIAQTGKFKLFLIIALILFASIIILLALKNKGILFRGAKENKELKAHTKELEYLTRSDYNLIFFGGFQVFDKQLVDITNKFSPLLKELFLLILLNTYKNNKGISSEKIIEILWSDKSERSARNNRAVNIAKLKGICNEIGECDISKKTGYWKINFSEEKIKSDYLEFLKITSSKQVLTKQKVNHLIEITEKGAFLFNVHYDWLDDFKAMVSDRIIDTLVKFGQSIDVKEEADFVIHLADSVFNFDVVNEEAMIFKCQAQNCMGKHSLAKGTYEKFCKEYATMYGENYEKAFTEILVR